MSVFPEKFWIKLDGSLDAVHNSRAGRIIGAGPRVWLFEGDGGGTEELPAGAR